MKVCPECGSPLKKNAKFCGVCGAAVVVPVPVGTEHKKTDTAERRKTSSTQRREPESEECKPQSVRRSEESEERKQKSARRSEESEERKQKSTRRTAEPVQRKPESARRKKEEPEDFEDYPQESEHRRTKKKKSSAGILVGFIIFLILLIAIAVMLFLRTTKVVSQNTEPASPAYVFVSGLRSEEGLYAAETDNVAFLMQE